MNQSLVPIPSRSQLTRAGFKVFPALIARAGDRASWRFVEFFTATIRNKNTRAAYAQAIRLKPTHAPGHANLGVALQEQGLFNEALAEHREALRLQPDYAEAYNNIAAGYQSMARWDDAIAAAKEAIRLKPDFQLARQ